LTLTPWWYPMTSSALPCLPAGQGIGMEPELPSSKVAPSPWKQAAMEPSGSGPAMPRSAPSSPTSPLALPPANQPGESGKLMLPAPSSNGSASSSALALVPSKREVEELE
jgi:hypothetical protein